MSPWRPRQQKPALQQSTVRSTSWIKTHEKVRSAKTAWNWRVIAHSLLNSTKWIANMSEVWSSKKSPTWSSRMQWEQTLSRSTCIWTRVMLLDELASWRVPWMRSGYVSTGLSCLLAVQNVNPTDFLGLSLMTKMQLRVLCCWQFNPVSFSSAWGSTRGSRREGLWYGSTWQNLEDSPTTIWMMPWTCSKQPWAVSPIALAPLWYARIWSQRRSNAASVVRSGRNEMQHV